MPGHMAGDTGRPAPEVAIRFYRAAGYNEEQLERYTRRKFGNFGKAIATLPHSFRRLVDRETITIGDRYWQVIVGSGHSHQSTLALYCPALKLLISGDQVLPRITPNVSVFPHRARRAIRSRSGCVPARRIRDILPDDVLVLPAHEAPFYGLHVRMTQLIEIGHNTRPQHSCSITCRNREASRRLLSRPCSGVRSKRAVWDWPPARPWLTSIACWAGVAFPGDGTRRAWTGTSRYRSRQTCKARTGVRALPRWRPSMYTVTPGRRSSEGR